MAIVRWHHGLTQRGLAFRDFSPRVMDPRKNNSYNMHGSSKPWVRKGNVSSSGRKNKSEKEGNLLMIGT